MRRYRQFQEEDDMNDSGDYRFQWFGNNRHICDVLEDMRKCAKSQNFSPIRGLIEEAQVMANRMESALQDQKDLIKIGIELSEARKAYKKLEREYKDLDKKVKLKRPKQNTKS